MSTHSNHSMHQNSLAAYADNIAKMSDRETEIFEYLKLVSEPKTDREIMAGLGYNEPNAVRPRITTMLKPKDEGGRGVLEEGEPIVCPITNKTVRTVQINVVEAEEVAA